MKVIIPVGHSILKSGATTSAVGIKNEYQFNKAFAPVLAESLRSRGWQVDTLVIPERTMNKSTDEKGYKIPRINGKGYDLCMELHLNSYYGSAKGCEVLYKSSKGKEYALKAQSGLVACGFTNRGVKYRDNLYMLNSTDCPSIMLESFFCDNKTDCDIADRVGMKGMAENIATKLTGKGGASSVVKYKVLVDKLNSPDHDIARIFKWKSNEVVIEEVDAFKSWSADNLYLIGGVTIDKFKSKGFADNYTPFNGVDRYDTLNQVIEFKLK